MDPQRSRDPSSGGRRGTAVVRNGAGFSTHAHPRPSRRPGRLRETRGGREAREERARGDLEELPARPLADPARRAVGRGRSPDSRLFPPDVWGPEPLLCRLGLLSPRLLYNLPPRGRLPRSCGSRTLQQMGPWPSEMTPEPTDLQANTPPPAIASAGPRSHRWVTRTAMPIPTAATAGARGLVDATRGSDHLPGDPTVARIHE